jgi:hypothetical protein
MKRMLTGTAKILCEMNGMSKVIFALMLRDSVAGSGAAAVGTGSQKTKRVVAGMPKIKRARRPAGKK